jgi:predicted transcriptional regulator
MDGARISPEPFAADEQSFIDAVKAGLSALDGGRSILYDDVRRWLLSWGAEDEALPPRCP